MSGERVLIIEDVFLIALSMQDSLEAAFDAQTVVARDFAEAGTMSERFGEFDLAIVNAPRDNTDDWRIAGLLADAGVAIVVCTAARPDLGSGPLAGAEMIIKPYIDEDLLAACRRALEKRRPG